MTPAFCFPTTTLVSEAPRFESIMEDVEVGAGETARFRCPDTSLNSTL